LGGRGQDLGGPYGPKNTARLENDREVSFDFVVLGTGVAPRLELARESGLDVADGVIVDNEMRTGAPGIWAAGDVAQFPEYVTGQSTRIEHWVVAERQGQCAARSMLGSGRPYQQAPFFWTRHYTTSIQYVGYAHRWDRMKVKGSVPDGDALVAYMQDERIVAVAAIGRGRDALKAARAFETNDQPGLHALFG
jgi:apoptosis-inducing factor 3